MWFARIDISIRPFAFKFRFKERILILHGVAVANLNLLRTIVSTRIHTPRCRQENRVPVTAHNTDNPRNGVGNSVEVREHIASVPVAFSSAADDMRSNFKSTDASNASTVSGPLELLPNPYTRPLSTTASEWLALHATCTTFAARGSSGDSDAAFILTSDQTDDDDAFITVRSSLVPLIEGLCAQIYFRFEISVVCVHIFYFSFSEEKIC